MKLFIEKLLGYVIVISTTGVLVFYLLKPKWNVGQEVQKCVDLLNSNDNFILIDTFRLGDSVGKNLIGTNRDSNTLNLGSNQAISVLGQLLFFNKFIKGYQNDISSVVFEGYIKPKSFFNNLNQVWTFNYFIKYFYNKDWFFNEIILNKSSQNTVDVFFLNNYEKKYLIKRTYFKGFSLFTYPTFGSDKMVTNSIQYNLIECIDDNDLKEFKERIIFKSMPVSKKFFEGEKISYLKLRNLGFNIKSPFVINDSFFIEDGIHIKHKFRNKEFYKRISKLENAHIHR